MSSTANTKTQENPSTMRSQGLKSLKEATLENISKGPRLTEREKSVLNSLKISPKDGIVRIFFYDFKERKGAFFKSIAAENAYFVRNLPYAWVLKAGEEFKMGDLKINDGDVIRLYDWKTQTKENPEFKARHNNEQSNSNGQLQGEDPDQFVHGVHAYYHDRRVHIDHLSEPELKDSYTFCLPYPEIFGVVTDLKSLTE